MTIRWLLSTLVLLLMGSAAGGLAQMPAAVPAQPAAVSAKDARRIAAVQTKAATLPPDARISVIRIGGLEQFGEFRSGDAEALTFFDVDRKREFTVPYAQIRKLKEGYGGYNFVRGTHTDPSRGLWTAVAVLGVLISLVLFVAVADH